MLVASSVNLVTVLEVLGVIVLILIVIALVRGWRP